MHFEINYRLKRAGLSQKAIACELGVDSERGWERDSQPNHGIRGRQLHRSALGEEVTALPARPIHLQKA